MTRCVTTCHRLPGRACLLKASACGLFRAEFRNLKFNLDRLDPAQHLGPQLIGHWLGAAVLVHETLHCLFEPVLAQARAAFIEVHTDLRVPGILDLPRPGSCKRARAPRYRARRAACRSSSRVLPGFGTR